MSGNVRRFHWNMSVQDDPEGVFVYATDYLKLAKERDSLLADALRYRWLRACKYDVTDVMAIVVSRGMFMTEDGFDAAIDSAMKEQKA